MTDSQLFAAQAQRCRRLARLSDEREAKILIEMAEEYEAKARSLQND